MSDYLVNRFFESELDDHIRELIEEVVADDAPRRYLTFNVHNVVIDVRNGSVTIEDVLDPSNESTVSLSSFLARVRNRAAAPVERKAVRADWGVLVVTDLGSSEELPDWSDDPGQLVSAGRSGLFVKVELGQEGPVDVSLILAESMSELPVLAFSGNLTIASGVVTIAQPTGEVLLRRDVPVGEHRVQVWLSEPVQARKLEVYLF